MSSLETTVGLQRGVEAECELKYCVDEEGRGLKPRVTGRRKTAKREEEEKGGISVLPKLGCLATYIG